ncbi:MAG: hypothetical protein IT455_05170 [Planctomycetes bacterium]|nr:hypothetical protein [Planctomycetota bacterium]
MILAAAVAGALWGLLAGVGVFIGVTILFVVIGTVLQKTQVSPEQKRREQLRDECRRKYGDDLPPLTNELRGVFDRITGRQSPPSPTGAYSKEPDPLEDTGPLSLGGAIKSLMEQDAHAYARGETPEARLVPHHAIKRDVILAAYAKDFHAHVALLQSMQWTEAEKGRRIAAAKADFEKHVYGVKRLGWPELDKIIGLMRKTRTDLKELETDVLSKGSYPLAEPL